MYDVFVAGLGVMGGAIARAFARAGRRVLGCDARQPPHEFGSSHGESRIIRAAYFEDPVYAPLAQRAFELWRELESESGRSLLRVTGGLNMGPRAGVLVEGALASARAHGIKHELLDGNEVVRRYPGYRVRATDAAVFEPTAGILDPEQCVAAQLESARSAGADLRLGDPFIGWQRAQQGFEIETSSGRHQARMLVLTVGAWLSQFRPELPLKVTRQPVFWFEPTNPVLYSPDRLPHFLIEFEPGRIFYGFPDLGRGLKCAIHHEGVATSPDLVARSLAPTELAVVRSLVAQFLPGALGPLRTFGICLYTNLPDGHFLLDRDPQNSDLWLVSACSGHGFKFAPPLAELLLAAQSGSAIPECFSLQRLARFTPWLTKPPFIELTS
ncbi:MAG: N-methyl-L-tryptophan oxidase [Longimicrobiales bacterium]